MIFLVFFANMNLYAGETSYLSDDPRCEKTMMAKAFTKDDFYYLNLRFLGEDKIQTFKLKECFIGNDQRICHFFDNKGIHLISIFDDYLNEDMLIYKLCYYTRLNT